MKLKDNASIRKIGNEYIMVSESTSGLNYSRVISLNESAKYLIEELSGKEFTLDECASLLVNKYGIDQEVAVKDATLLAEKLKDAGLLM